MTLLIKFQLQLERLKMMNEFVIFGASIYGAAARNFRQLKSVWLPRIENIYPKAENVVDFLGSFVDHCPNLADVCVPFYFGDFFDSDRYREWRPKLMTSDKVRGWSSRIQFDVGDCKLPPKCTDVCRVDGF